jgi:hypothetical protein
MSASNVPCEQRADRLSFGIPGGSLPEYNSSCHSWSIAFLLSVPSVLSHLSAQLSFSWMTGTTWSNSLRASAPEPAADHSTLLREKSKSVSKNLSYPALPYPILSIICFSCLLYKTYHTLRFIHPILSY